MCRALDVELVLEHNTGALPYWGQMGHYSIATFATDALAAGPLRTFFRENLDQISFRMSELDPDDIKAGIDSANSGAGVIPLADVPDLLWKNHASKVKGGRDTRWAGKGRSTGPEHPTHYADIDQPRATDHKTLRQLCLEDEKNISVAVWKKFYDGLGHTEERSRGLLPFRIWQFYDALVEFAQNKQADRFLCAAGILSHYVGDACQPLHGSIYSDGYADREVKITHHKRDTGEAYEETSHVGAGVHSTYETKMVDRYSTQLVQGIDTAVKNGQALPTIQTGRDAAKAAIALMERSAKRIPPKDLVEAYLKAGGKSVVAVQDALWKEFGKQTVACMADGARVLAHIWSSAWKRGKGSQISHAKLVRIAPSRLKDLYKSPKFVESLDLDQIGKVLK